MILRGCSVSNSRHHAVLVSRVLIDDPQKRPRIRLPLQLIVSSPAPIHDLDYRQQLQMNVRKVSHRSALASGRITIVSAIAERLSKRVRLTEAEVAFLDLLASASIPYRRRQTIQRADEPVCQAYMLKSGWAISSCSFPDGSRQIRRVHLPGDLLAMSSLAMRHHVEDIETLTDAVIAPFERKKFARLFVEYPRLATIMFIFAQEERITAGDRMGCIGRLDCRARIAFLLLDILHRVRAVDPSTASSFEMHLRREEMAEITGMTAIHASRMWSELIAEGLIRSEGPFITILDETRLKELSGYVNRSENLDFNWLAEQDSRTRMSSVGQTAP